MKHFYQLLFTFLFLPNLSFAQQNLVPNGSFEDTVACPPFFISTYICEGWYSCGISPDYFHPCANNSTNNNFGVPSNLLGYQQPYNGAAYSGLVTFGTGAQYPIREFLGAQLLQTLIPGTRYYVSSHISRGNLYTSDCSTNKFGFRFFTQPNDALNTPPIDNFAHVYSNVVVTDTSSWIKVQGSFVADSAYKYIIIGNFFDDVETTITGCNTAQSVQAYYYIDKVCLSTDSLICEVLTGNSSHLANPVFWVGPNPATEIINITTASMSGNYQFSIFDMHGREVIKNQNLIIPQTQVPISQLPPGLFFVRISSQSQSYLFKAFKK